jgi:hypothetical protein
MALYCFWTGNNAMTENRKKCFNSLKNSELNVILITSENFKEYEVEPLHEGYAFLSETHKADYLRTYFMHFYGGAYCDIKFLENSWKNCMQEFIEDDNCWIMGYKEIGPDGCAIIKNDPILTTILKQNWTSLIGNGAYLCKPKTPLTYEWYNKLIKKMNENLDQLKKYPSTHSTQVYSSSYPYPFMWTELLGQIFHPLLLNYKEKVRNNLKPPLFTNYK